MVQNNKVLVTCVECGKQEYVFPSRAKTYVCCSVSCMGKYNSKRYSTKISKTCPICGKVFYFKQSHANKHKTCGNKECSSQWRSITTSGCNNSNYKDISVSSNIRKKSEYQHVVKAHFQLKSIKDIPKGYNIHHKDANPNNNLKSNLVLLPKSVHMLLHRIFGNILLNALHSNKITRDEFYSMCTLEQKQFYEQIIDLDITRQVVVKQGELLETPEEDNQQPSIYRNIYVGSETNSRVLPDNAEDSNTDTSALPVVYGEDIVRTACITNEDAELEDKELLG